MPKKILHPFTAIGIRTCQICGADFLWINKWGKAHQKYCGPACSRVARNTQKEQCPKLERSQTTPRLCLRCSNIFSSWGKGNRICPECKSHDTDLFKHYNELALIGGRGSI